MSTFSLALETGPNTVAYDSGHPTKSTELYCNALHHILEDMDDQTTWRITDGIIESTSRSAMRTYIYDSYEVVFDYAAQAIEDHRNDDPISITAPLLTSVETPPQPYNEIALNLMFEVYRDCTRMLFVIYYMWKTEADPLLLKEKLQELLVAWPLLENTIELNSDLGQQFKVYPSWKNADL